VRFIGKTSTVVAVGALILVSLTSCSTPRPEDGKMGLIRGADGRPVLLVGWCTHPPQLVVVYHRDHSLFGGDHKLATFRVTKGLSNPFELHMDGSTPGWTLTPVGGSTFDPSTVVNGTNFRGERIDDRYVTTEVGAEESEFKKLPLGVVLVQDYNPQADNYTDMTMSITSFPGFVRRSCKAGH